MNFKSTGGRGRGYRSFAGTPSKAVERSPMNFECNSEPSQSSCSKQFVTTSSCTTIAISTDVSQSSVQWFAQLKQLWSLLKNAPPVTNMLHKHFESCENPYEEALRLMYNCVDFNNAKPKSLSYLIMEEFKNWSSAVKDRIIHLLRPDIKVSAFNIVRQQRLFSLMTLVAVVYEMAEDCDMFFDIIKYMIQEKKYKEACQSVVLLGLQNRFGIEAFLVPLVLQDKLVCVDGFLTESSKHRSELVTYLDSILGQSTTVRDALEPFIMEFDIPDVKWEKLHSKPWKKLIARLVKMFDLPPDVSPFLNKKRNQGTLQFLLHKRYIDNTFGDESWREMVEEAVKDDEKLQLELVFQVAYHSDTAEALRWAHFYNLDRADWPQSVRMYEEDPDQSRHQQQFQVDKGVDETWNISGTPVNVPKCYHTYPLPRNTIHLVETGSSLENLLDSITNTAIIGVDCEWKPSFGNQKNELALMQIATRDAVFILDVMKLGSHFQDLWFQLGMLVFNNCDILKIGFGLSADISMIKHSLPNLGTIKRQIGLLDLLPLWKQIEKCPNIRLPFEVQNGGPSLATLVQLCFGKPLDKKDQFSNWENRPLRESQIIYAALDAYCLIQVYDVLKQSCEAADFPFDDTCYSTMSAGRIQKKKTTKSMYRRHKPEDKITAQPPSPHIKPVPACEVKVVCDTMLQGLGKSLRRCGVDAAILENKDNHMVCVRHAQDERRYILTRGTAFNLLMGYVPQGCCLRIISDDVDEQLKEVLDYYNVVVTKDDVFSRCQLCNSNSFIKISRSTMIALTQVEQLPLPPPPCYRDDLFEEATGFSSDEEFYECAPSDEVPVRNSRKWDICSDENIDVGLCMTRQGAKIQVDSVPMPLLQKYDLFYVCESCGKVYWDGSHLNKVISGRLQGIVVA